jgi:hypothetical protein
MFASLMFGELEQETDSITHESEITDLLVINQSISLSVATGEFNLHVYQGPYTLPVPDQTVIHYHDDLQRFTDQLLIDYTFTLSVSERRVFQRFIKQNFLNNIRVVDHEGDIYSVYFRNTSQNRLNADEFYPIDHLVITVNLIGEKIGNA